MFACLASNGRNVYPGTGPCTRLLVGTTEGFVEFEREDANAPWVAKGSQVDGVYIGVCCYNTERNLLWAGGFEGGVFFSTDQGRTWEARNNGLPTTKIYCLNYVEADGEFILYCGIEPARLFESRDFGLSWTELPALRDVPDTDKWTFPPPPHIAHVNSLAFDPRDHKTFYVGVEQGALLKTTDGGQSFRELADWARDDDSQYKDVHQIAVRPSQPDHVYMTVGVGFYYSQDAGETWTCPTGKDFRLGYPDRMLLKPDDDLSILITGSAYNPSDWFQTHEADAAVMRSRDGGKTWAQVEGLPHMQGNIEAMTMHVWEGGYTVFIGNTDGNIYSSEDFGESWTQIGADQNPISKCGHYRILEMVRQ